MKTENLVVILHGRVAAEDRADEQDVLEEVRQISEALTVLGYKPLPVPLSLNLEAAARLLREQKPLMVFNLVESIEGQDRLLHLASCLLDSLGIPYTGSRSRGMVLATDKLLAKRLFLQDGIDTPAWSGAAQALASDPDFEPPYIVKSVWDNASLGLECIYRDRQQLRKHLSDLASGNRLEDRFVERYIGGREFNLSLLQEGPEVQVLPPAEMLFVDYPPEKPRIVGYAAKWDPDSFEYNHTVRRFDFDQEDRPLLDRLCELARACWNLLGMGGYARADFRVDPQGTPWLLEVNPNPCISADAGLAAAAERAGLSYTDLVRRILQPVLDRIAGAACSELEGESPTSARRSSRS